MTRMWCAHMETNNYGVQYTLTCPYMHTYYTDEHTLAARASRSYADKCTNLGSVYLPRGVGSSVKVGGGGGAN